MKLSELKKLASENGISLKHLNGKMLKKSELAEKLMSKGVVVKSPKKSRKPSRKTSRKKSRKPKKAGTKGAKSKTHSGKDFTGHKGNISKSKGKDVKKYNPNRDYSKKASRKPKKTSRKPKKTSRKPKKTSRKPKKTSRKPKKKPRVKISDAAVKRNTKDCQRVRFDKKALQWSVYLQNIIQKTNEWKCYGSCITSNELCMTDKDCDKDEKCSKQSGNKYLHYDYSGHYCCKDKPPTYLDGLRFIREILEPGLENNPPYKQKDLDQYTKYIAWYKAYFQKAIKSGKSVSDKYL